MGLLGTLAAGMLLLTELTGGPIRPCSLIGGAEIPRKNPDGLQHTFNHFVNQKIVQLNPNPAPPPKNFPKYCLNFVFLFFLIKTYHHKYC